MWFLYIDYTDTVKAQAVLIQRRYQHDLAHLLTRWSEFTCTVEDGYPYSIFEYTNSLGGRNVLFAVEQVLSAEGQQQLQTVLSAWDERFRAATTSIDRPLRAIPGKPTSWWYYRLPRVLRGEFREDLVDEGFLEPFSKDTEFPNDNEQ